MGKYTPPYVYSIPYYSCFVNRRIFIEIKKPDGVPSGFSIWLPPGGSLWVGVDVTPYKEGREYNSICFSFYGRPIVARTFLQMMYKGRAEQMRCAEDGAWKKEKG